MPRFARSVRTTDRALLIDGDEFPFYVQDSLTVEVLSPPSDGAPGLFVVTIGLMVEGEVCIQSGAQQQTERVAPAVQQALTPTR